jgi:hypothetical protein
MQITSREYGFPIIADKCPVDVFKHWMHTFIALSVEPAIEVNLFQHGIVEEAAELPHPSTIKPVIALILSYVNHVKVATQEPRARPILPDHTQFSKEG